MLHLLQAPAAARKDWVVGMLRGHATLTMTTPTRMMYRTTTLLAKGKREIHPPLKAATFREAAVEVHAATASKTTTTRIKWHECLEHNMVVHLLRELRAAAARRPANVLEVFRGKLPACVQIATDASRRAATGRQLAEARTAKTRLNGTAAAIDVKTLLGLQPVNANAAL